MLLSELSLLQVYLPLVANGAKLGEISVLEVVQRKLNH